MKIDLRKFFEAFDKGSPHHLAAVDQLAEEMPDDLLDKFSDWVVCFEVEGEIDPLIEETHKGYIMKEPWQYT